MDSPGWKSSLGGQGSGDPREGGANSNGKSKDQQERKEESEERPVHEEKPQPEESTLDLHKDPVNVDSPVWKSSQGGQGSGDPREGGAKSKGKKEDQQGKEDVPGTRTGVGGEVAPVGDQVHGPEEGQVWVTGASEEDQDRYRKLMAYIEKSREEKIQKETEDIPKDSQQQREGGKMGPNEGSNKILEGELQ